MENTQTLYNKIYQFNNLAENLNIVTIDDISNQLDIDYSEVIETIDAFDEKDTTEYIDGLADKYVTLTGLIQQMEALGFDMEEAINRVCDNNLTKFINADIDIDSIANLQPANTEAIFIPQHNVIVFKDENGKVKKPLNYIPVDLSDLVVKDIFKETT